MIDGDDNELLLVLHPSCFPALFLPIPSSNLLLPSPPSNSPFLLRKGQEPHGNQSNIAYQVTPGELILWILLWCPWLHWLLRSFLPDFWRIPWPVFIVWLWVCICFLYQFLGEASLMAIHLFVFKNSTQTCNVLWLHTLTSFPFLPTTPPSSPPVPLVGSWLGFVLW